MEGLDIIVKKLEGLNLSNDKYEFLRSKHVKFCLRCLGVLPERTDSSRIPSTFFAISALDLMQALDEIEQDRQNLIDWIYSMQVTSNENDQNPVDYGFIVSTTCVIPFDKNSDVCDKAHVAMTYTALATLIILGDDLSRVDKVNIIASLKNLQLPDGSFRPMNIGCENDMRFVYCVACICYILQDWSSIDVSKTLEYIKKSQNFDGGIGQGPGLESHGGSTFCAIAALSLMGELNNAFSPQQLKNLKRWLVFRQTNGFHGRPNKPDDTCYSFWIGATLKLLDCYDYMYYPSLLNYVLASQDEIIGGISKWEDIGPDMLHTYLAISGLMLNTSFTNPALNISERASKVLSKLHDRWKSDS